MITVNQLSKGPGGTTPHRVGTRRSTGIAGIRRTSLHGDLTGVVLVLRRGRGVV